jgi:hypothetical protein
MYHSAGYVVLICLVPGNICGSIVALKSLGGEINIQLIYYLLGIMITFSGLIGIWNVKKNTNAHRKWMLSTPFSLFHSFVELMLDISPAGMVTYFCVIITARVVMYITRAVIAKIGTFYSVCLRFMSVFVLPYIPFSERCGDATR